MDLKQISTYTKLVNKAVSYIRQNNIFAERSINDLRRCWRRLPQIMKANSIVTFDDKTSVIIIKSLEHMKGKQELVKAVNKLAQFYSTGKVGYRTSWRRRRDYVLNGPIGDLATGFLEHCRHRQLSTIRINNFERNLVPFCEFCNKNDIKTLGLSAVLDYVRRKRLKSIRYEIEAIIALTKYLFLNGIIKVNFEKQIPRFRAYQQPKIPSIYSEEEIRKMVSTIERSSSRGKRDYAIFIMVWRLGVRISDVANLQFNHLNLEKNLLTFNQVKTNVLQTLPLVPELKAALVDYLQFGRRKSTEPYVFLMQSPPFGKMTSRVLTCIFTRALNNSGINKGTRSSGPRSLRSSLASVLLKKSVSLSVIANVLGHSFLDATKHYLRIDQTTLSKCAVEVPPIDPQFYTDNGFIL